MAISVGARLGPYEILTFIGRGGMGEVYRARDTTLDRDVALKVLRPEFALDAERLARFKREARVLASLSHPNIAGIHGLEDRDGPEGSERHDWPLALVLELVEGTTLADRIAQGPIPIDEALRLASQIVDALEAAHGKGIVHRDVKPSNIKISPSGTVKVLDFGLASVGSSEPSGHGETQSPTASSVTPDRVAGTFPYMSPEQARGQAIDKRTDIWAFGCVLFEMIAGRNPFKHETAPDTLAAILAREPDWQSLPDAAPPIRRLLQRCLEKDPRRRLRDISDARDYVEEAVSFGSHSRSNHNLPSELTSFVGRRTELDALASLLQSARLVSMTGPGGVGKTRLAMRFARDVVNQFADGVWFVDLAPIASPALVVQAIASAVGVREAPQRSVRDALLDDVRGRELLIVLDNCEHLIDGCAELAEALLRHAPALRMLATSRESLGVPGESVWRIPSLSLPDASAAPAADQLRDFEATQLFIDRATSIDPAFTASAESADTIAGICRQLDGIPLAIELAAARIGALSVEQIEARLKDRFRLLTGGARTAAPRQRTLEATVQWSYQLLSDVEREVLNRLSVFPAGFTLEAAERVCGADGINPEDIVDIVSRLVNKSLVGRENQGAGGRRYRLLDTVRHYARERLTESGALVRLRDRHLAWIHEEFRDALPVLQGRGQADCLRRLRVERHDVRAALEWALSSPARAPKGLDLAGALFWYWTKRGEFAEGREWLERALAATGHEERSSRARALIGLARILLFQGHIPDVAAAATEALALGRETGDAWAISWALYWLALVAVERGDHAQAAALAIEARDASRGEDSVAGPLGLLAMFAMVKGEHDRAQQLSDEANNVNRRAGEIWGLAFGLVMAAILGIARKDFVSARAQLSEALSLNEELEDPRGIAWSLAAAVGLLVGQNDVHNAVRLWGATDAIVRRIGVELPPFLKFMRDRHRETIEASLGRDQFEAAFAEGRGMSSVQAISLARQQLERLH
jgi:predicted ATPase/serine/threonine protein kinase